MSTNNRASLEIVYEGWLTKSPPSKPIWRARWRRRWFILRHSGELPGQYFLEYYTDRNCRKLKGKIDLDQCDQVDAGLQFQNSKQKYQYMFDLKTPKRTYLLAAETDEEMNKWVEYVCHVCHLIAFKDDEEDFDYTVTAEDDPPVSPTSTTSGPYIPISECISGRPLSGPHGLDQLNDMLRQGGYGRLTAMMCYDSPRQLRRAGTPPDGENVFTDEEWAAPPAVATPLPTVNWETFPPSADPPSECDGDVGSWSVVRKFGRLTVVDSKRVLPACVTTRWNQTLPHNKPAPPRPPKPVHLLDGPSHNYLNLEYVRARSSTHVALAAEAIPSPPPVSPPHTTVLVGGLITDETYDFPRSHQQHQSEQTNVRHCYTNAAPSQVSGDIFRYDFHHNDLPLCPDRELVTTEEPQSPRSEGSGSLAALYSNLPSPLVATDGSVSTPPPAVNRGLKPGRKLSDSAVSGGEPSPGAPLTPGGLFPPPSVDRKLKPCVKYSDTTSETGGTLELAPPPDGTRSLRKIRAAPSPTPPPYTNATIRNNGHQRHNSSSEENLGTTQDDEVYHFHERDRFVSSHTRHLPEIHYLDLAHDAVVPSSSSSANQTPRSPERLAPTTTVYKTVDFLKTQAFNKTRQKVEEERKMSTADLL